MTSAQAKPFYESPFLTALASQFRKMTKTLVPKPWYAQKDKIYETMNGQRREGLSILLLSDHFTERPPELRFMALEDCEIIVRATHYVDRKSSWVWVNSGRCGPEDASAVISALKQTYEMLPSIERSTKAKLDEPWNAVLGKMK